MARILVIPENLHSLSAQLQQVTGELQSVDNRIGNALGGLDWEARQKAGVDGQVNYARSQARALVAHAEEMARYLRRKAQAFEEADGQGVRALVQIGASFTQWQQQNIPARPAFPARRIAALGTAFGQPSPAQLLRLPLAGGTTVVGLAGLTSLSQAFLEALKDFGEYLWHWLRHKGEKPPAESPTVKDKSKTEAKPKPQPESRPEKPPATEPPSQAPAAQPAKSTWWHDVPLQSQRGLKYGKNKTNYGCTPTATSMILDYWHAQDPANKTMSAQELLDINAGQGVFGAEGMSATNVLDEVQGLGYGVTEVHANSNREILQQALAGGPVLAIVKLNMRATGDNHAVVITGISDDGQVRINDPWTGQAHTYSWDDFARSWGANFGQDAPTNNFVAIRPS